MTSAGIQYVGIQLVRTEDTHISQAVGSRALAQHAKQLLKQVQMGKNEKKSYNHQKFMYSLASDGEGHKYLVVTPEDYPRLTSFECLEQMKRVFAIYKSDVARLDEEVGKLVAKYSDPNANKVAQVRAQVEETKRVMVDNIDQVIARGEKIEDVCAETDRLQNEAAQFQRNARELKHQMWKKKLLYIFAGIVALLIIAFVVILLACRDGNDGIFNWDKCKAK
jgi:predicted S18 family serine protease